MNEKQKNKQNRNRIIKKNFQMATLSMNSRFSNNDPKAHAQAIKVTMIGNAGVGKSTIIQDIQIQAKQRYITKKDTPVATIGIDFVRIYYVNPHGNEYTVQFWDTSGQERYANT